MTETAPDRSKASRLGWFAVVLGFWISVAALTGFGHGIELVAARAAGRLAWFSREFLWMSPVAYALVMSPGAIVLALVAAAFRRTWTLALAAGAFVLVGAFGLLLPYSEISRLAALILSAGVAVVVARSVNEKPWVWANRARIGAMVAAVAVMVLAPAQRWYLEARESRAIASLPDDQPGSPNVLVIILDTVRAASMGLYGNPQQNTPHLNELSKSATVFDWAFSPAPWTLPSHGSMFTGVTATEQSGDWERPLDNSLPTLAERFRDRGYLTGGFVGNMHYTAWDSGLPRGFVHYEDYLVNWQQLLRSSSYTQTALFNRLRSNDSFSEKAKAFLRPNLAIDMKHVFSPKRGNQVSDAFLEWQASSGDRPFFAFLNYFDAHLPYYAPPAFRRFQGDSQPEGLATYLAAIAFLDSEVDRVLSTLRQRNVLDRTLVVVASDHGELFAFKGLNGHAHNLYLNTIHVPLLVRFPGHVPEGQRVETPVTLRDLAATIMELAAPSAPPLSGVSLSAAWTGAGPLSPVVSEVTKARNIDARYPTSRGDMQTLIDGQWQLIRNGDERLELYAYRADSLEDHDLAASDSSASLLAELKQRLLELLRPSR